jgi:hypothetical protein
VVTHCGETGGGSRRPTTQLFESKQNMKTKSPKTEDAKALLKLKKWLKKQGRQSAQCVLAVGLPDADEWLGITVEFKEVIARSMVNCIEDYQLSEFWRGQEGYYFVEHVEGLDDFGRALDEDDCAEWSCCPDPAPVKVRHPDGDARLEWLKDNAYDYAFGHEILLLDDHIHASNTRDTHKSHEMEFQPAPNFPVLEKLVAKAGRKFDEVYRSLIEEV